MFISDKALLDQVKAYLDRTIDDKRITANYILSPPPAAQFPFVVISIDTGDQEVQQIDYGGDEDTLISLDILCPLDKAHDTVGRNTNIERLIYATDALRKQVFRKDFMTTLRTNLQSSTLRFGSITRRYGTIEEGGNRHITSTIQIPVPNFITYE